MSSLEQTFRESAEKIGQIPDSTRRDQAMTALISAMLATNGALFVMDSWIAVRVAEAKPVRLQA